MFVSGGAACIIGGVDRAKLKQGVGFVFGGLNQLLWPAVCVNCHKSIGEGDNNLCRNCWSELSEGCGGYGYNMTYIGSRLWKNGIKSTEAWREAYERTTRTTEVGRPVETVMFADTAMSNDGRSLIEYSFAEPPFTVHEGRPVTSFYMSPSIHFRHKEKANVGWADGHLEQREMAKFDNKNAYGVDSTRLKLGWFEPIDNTPFDLE